MANEREQAELQRHIKEAEERAAAGGHRLTPWRASPNRGFCLGGNLYSLWREGPGRVHSAKERINNVQ
jgi:hypothetical protein